jgi:phosphoribosylaminoimidazole carboxylase (NCAIR synthetase)
MKALRFRLNLPREEALRYYRGEASTVIVRAENGQTVSFPAQHLRPYIDQRGIVGQFVIRFDNNNKMQSLDRIGN